MKENELTEIKANFIAKWGVVGTAWGVNRTMGQVFILLTLTQNPLSTDQIMKELKISRGNANTTLRELVSWGIVIKSIPLGTRKEYFTAEKSQWKIACRVAEARRFREIVPAIELLTETVSKLKKLNTKEAKFIKSKLDEIFKFLNLINAILKKLGTSEQNKVMQWISKFIS